jgi:hypothetical protein
MATRNARRVMTSPTTEKRVPNIAPEYIERAMCGWHTGRMSATPKVVVYSDFI